MKSKSCLILMLIIVVGLFMASCGAEKKAAADAAIKAAEDAYEYAKPKLMKFLPDQTKAVEDTINSAKASLEKKDYTTALATAKAVPGKIEELTIAAAAKKVELTKTWEESTAGIPRMLQLIKGKLTIYSIPKEVPPSMSKTKLTSARNGYQDASTKWEEAQNDFSANNLFAAIAKADTVKTKATEVMGLLGIKAPATPTKG